MSTSTFIIGNGARTPVGMQAAASAAALRAGISRIREHVLLPDRPWTLRLAALDSKLDKTLTGPGRFVALAESAFREACVPLSYSRQLRFPIPVYLALPEVRPGFSKQDAESIRGALTRLDGLPLEVSEINIFTEGHAAGFLALSKATEHICRGAVDVCLVGGVDSYFHPETMCWLDQNRQLAGGDARSAFVPGEGSGFCLLASERAVGQLGIPHGLRVAKVAIGRETNRIKTDTLCVGEGLTETVKAVADMIPNGERIQSVICDMNGERYRGEEWGFVCLRLSQYFEDPTAYLSPADCWGDMGAASAPLFAVLATQAVARGYARGSKTLLWGSSEGGLRGAALLDMPGHI